MASTAREGSGSAVKLLVLMVVVVLLLLVVVVVEGRGVTWLNPDLTSVCLAACSRDA